MAGVVAMASVIEDFDTQPCRKACKEDSPMVKTITNYFSPVSKPTENPFSPPRSNNIMDYFNRKGPSPKTRPLSLNQAKENCQNGKQTTPVVPKQPARKRSRKASKTARKLVETAEDSSCIVIEDTDEVTGTCGVLGSDTAILLGQICAETSASSVTSDNANIEKDQHKKTSLVKSNCSNSPDLSPILPLKDGTKKKKSPAGNSRKRKKLEDELSEPEVTEMGKSLGEISMEVTVGDVSQLNNSTVTISFEDFVRNQEISSHDLCEEPESVVENDQPQITNAEENQQVESCLQVSPRVVTVLAEVHPISPNERGKSAAKVASIFTKEKLTDSIKETPTQTESNNQKAAKWKSNVVLLEEDVELCVVESSSTPKCSQAERKQFMAAFKQPSLDGTKTKINKSQGKQKPCGDKTTEATDKVGEEAPDIQPMTGLEKDTTTSHESKEGKKKPSGKRRKVEDVDTDNKDEPTASAVPVPVVRRSRRAAVARQTSTIAPESPPKSNSKGDFTKDVTASNQDTEISTPKKRKSKHGVFKAEMLCPPDDIESPIRIRLRRITTCRNKHQVSSTPLATKNAKDSKKTKQAKKLLEKAKAMKEKNLRRSSRTEASIKRSYCEDEDSILCVEDGQESTQSAPENSKSKKGLRSLNDVLGKAAPNKEPGPVCQDKAPRKPPVSIFDESSQEGSENSQDDEQFRARREFLKSGLPESFKKQMAKTAAAKEAYAMACSSFQPVLHVSQTPNDCLLWSLPWPQSEFIDHLKEICIQSFSINLENYEHLNWKTEPVRRVLSEKVSGWRPEISAGLRELLIKEISVSNPGFPAQKFLSHFMKKQEDLIQQCAASEPSSISKALCPELPNEGTGGKRKRAVDEVETVKIAKKQRSSQLVEPLSSPPAERALGKKELRPRRGAKSAPKDDGVKNASSPPVALVQFDNEAVIVLHDSPETKTVKPDLSKEEMQWTEKYQPQHSSEVIGNTTSVRRLHSWLKEWKLRADREDKKKPKDQKRDDESIDSDWEGGDEDSRDAEDMLCNTMLITGPPGVGKTAAVYACAQELGFKVFEVNSSSQRSGRLILSQLKEATQSHQVDSQGVNAHKPTYFNSYSTSSSAGRPGSSPRKVNSPRRAVSSPRKLPQSPRGSKRGGLAPIALANFFKVSKPGNKGQSNIKEEQTAISKKKPNEVDGKKTSIKSLPDAISKDRNPEDVNKKAATSLILFEEVDVVFDDDIGFLNAIKTFMMTTKRPVILTTSDPAFRAMFDGDFEEIIFEMPSVMDVASYLQLLCLAEDTRTDLKDINTLLSLNHCDVRKTLLQLQFWACSGGRQLTDSGSKEELQHGAVLTEMKDSVRLCGNGCMESMLGLLSIAPQQNIWEMLKKQESDSLRLVTLSRQQGVDLLYSNMEALLPLPLTTLTVSSHKRQPLPPPALNQSSGSPVKPPKLPSRSKLLDTEEDFSDASPVKVSNRMKKNRRRHCPSEQGVLQSDSDSEDGFLSIKRQSTPQVQEDVTVVPPKLVKKKLGHEELLKSVPVSQCLQSLADFMDDMSLVDLLSHKDCNVQHMLDSAYVKDGLTDEARIDTERRSGPLLECASEIGSQVQCLSFTKCCTSVRDAWHTVQQLDGELREEAAAQLTLPVASHNEGYTFTQHGLSHPHVKQRRKVMAELESKGAFGLMWNRPAAVQDYLPALRTICKSEQLKEQGKVKRRFLHYLDAIHLTLQKSTLERLAEDFP